MIGFNAGEWGGTLWWFSDTGKESYKISDDQIVGFMVRGDALFAIEGLAHLSISEGKVIKIVKNEKSGKYESVSYLTLPEAPDAVVLYKDGSFLIVTTASLVKIPLDGKIEKLLENTFWRALYPNSVVVDSRGDFYIGMRQGVAKISLSDIAPRIEWLVSSESFLSEEIENYKKRSK